MDTLSLYTQDEKIYLIDRDTTVVLFDYGLTVGDTFTISMPTVFNESYQSDFLELYAVAKAIPYRVVITDIDLIDYGGEFLKQWKFDRIGDDFEATHLLLFESFTERLGYDGFLIPLLSIDFLAFNPFSDLIKYEDATIQFQETSNDCIIVSTKDFVASSFQAISPNPSTGTLNITFPSAQSGQLSLMDVTGKLLSSLEVASVIELQLDLSSYQSELYLINFVSIDGRRYVDRVMIEE